MRKRLIYREQSDAVLATALLRKSAELPAYVECLTCGAKSEIATQAAAAACSYGSCFYCVFFDRRLRLKVIYG